jgi:subtilisin family serine protease
MSKISFKIVGLVIISSLLATNAYSQNNNECIPNEFIFSVSSLELLKTKTLEQLSEVSEQALSIKDETPKVVLIQSHPAKVATLSTDERKRPARLSADVCAASRYDTRAKKSLKRKLKRKAPIRRFSCSCNWIQKASAPKAVTVNDPLFAQQWGLQAESSGGINAGIAWNSTRECSNVVVAVIDTGIDYNHPDLKANMWINPGEIAGNGIDDDGNKVVDDVYGYNAVFDTGNPLDDNGHGTHVAGIIGAVGNNSIGITGVCWSARMMALKFLGATGSGSTMGAIKALNYLTAIKEKGTNIVASNNSWGGGGYSQELRDAIAKTEKAGVLFIAAAGNGGSDGVGDNNDVTPSYPAGYDLNSIISVAAVGPTGELAGFSNYGATQVELGAPGVDIASTYKSSWSYLSGTSMATPFVSGAVVLIASKFPTLTWQQLKQKLLLSVTPLNSLAGKTVTGGLLDVAAFYTESESIPQPTPTPITPTATPTITPTATLTPTPTLTATPTITPTFPNSNQILAGTVVDNNTTPIVGASLSLVTENGTYATRSDGTGKFSFPPLQTSRSFSITTTAGGYTFQVRTGVFDRNLNLNIIGTSVPLLLRVKILSETKLPLAGISVDAGALGNSVTNSNGIASFSIMYGSSYSLKVIDNQSWSFGIPEVSGISTGTPIERVFIAESTQ